jgi:hypothetical protein
MRRGIGVRAPKSCNTGGEMNTWPSGTVDVTVVMITLNEAHNLEQALKALKGWARQVIIVDSYSKDATVDIALQYGVDIVQRRFRSFGDQWNFALREMPIRAAWTLKLDPDERLTNELKAEIVKATAVNDIDGFRISIQLNFMQRSLPVKLRLLRLWRTGKARFAEVEANEHAFVLGKVGSLTASIQHHDSPNLDHWLTKQNRYTTAEASMLYQSAPMADVPKLMGSRLQRRMWLKSKFYLIPGRYTILFLYYLIVKGTWRSGWVGVIWARLRSDVMRMIHYKKIEMELVGRITTPFALGVGAPDPRVQQYD